MRSGRREMENRGQKRENVYVGLSNGERLWVDEKNAIYDGRGSGIDQSDCVL